MARRERRQGDAASSLFRRPVAKTPYRTQPVSITLRSKRATANQRGKKTKGSQQGLQGQHPPSSRAAWRTSLLVSESSGLATSHSLAATSPSRVGSWRSSPLVPLNKRTRCRSDIVSENLEMALKAEYRCVLQK
eukprot:scaffold24_cov245-Pinguiococcus_pyrenoidosus.AAC.3